MAQVKVTLIHSVAHRQPTQRRTVKALGLGKINSSVILPDNAATRGQMPLYRQIPKRGFTNINRKEYAIVNLASLNKFDDGTEVTPQLLMESGLVKNLKSGIKILGSGKLEKKLTVKANKFSASAVSAIEAAGGKTEVM